MFNNNPYTYMPQGPAFPRPAYQQPMQMYPQQVQSMQQPLMQDGSIQARFVSGREEAVASNVMPGSMFLFHARAHGMVYSKLIDPQTGMPDFRVYAEIHPEPQQPPQYATLEALSALRGEFEQIVDQKLAALTVPKAAARKGANVNDE